LPRAPHLQGGKPADPLLERGRESDVLRPFGLPRWAGVLLYAAFWFLLAIPLLRRWRRRPWWNAARLAVALAALAPFALWIVRAERPGFGWLTLAFFVLLVGGFALLTLL